MDGLTVIMKSIYDVLHADENLSSYGIWQNAATPKTAYPYILMMHSAGGFLNDAPYDAIEADILISVVAKTATEAKTIFGYIENALRNTSIAYEDSWHSWSKVREMEFFSRKSTVQNEEYEQVGAYFRFRISKGY